MNIQESLALFGIVNLSNENEQSLKRLYKRLMTKYHPDNYSGDDTEAKNISVAYRILKDTLINLNKIEKINKNNVLYKESILIDLDTLIKLYKDKEIVLKSKDNKVKTIGIKDLHINKVFIVINWSIITNGVVNNYTNICIWNTDDKYKIDCDIYVKDIKEECNIKVAILDKEKEYNIRSQSIRLNLVLDFNVNVEVNINKKN